jgi:hypothetical protein
MTKQDNGSYGGDEQLNVVFSRQDVFEKAKYFYENQSSFYPSDINDEFRTFVFDIENGEADVTERYLDQELQEKGLDGYYFEIADKYAEGGGIGNDKMKVNITKNEFQARKDEPSRVFHSYEGNIGDYTFTAETDSNGINGINKGSIYNLYISKVGGSNIARYDNKWEYRSKNTKDGAVRSAVIKYIDSISDKKDGESKYKDGDMNEYSKGGNIIERRYVNKDQDYETRYAKDKPSRMGYKDERKFAVGGEIGNTVSFKGDYGTPRSGVIKEKRGGSYIVGTDDGDRLVDSYEVISFSETPIAKKKRFGFFEGGGGIENSLNKRYLNGLPEAKKLRILINLSNHYGISLVNAFEEVTDIESEPLYEYITDKSLRMEVYNDMKNRRYAGGGEIENKIEKLKKVVSSKMLPESVKAKAQAEIDKLEKELHESKETKAEEKAEHKAGGSESKSKLEKDLEKELHRLQRDLNSFRLQIYTEGDDSEKEKARQRERTSKIIRMNEVLALLNEIEIGKENKMTGESEGERKAGMDKEARLDEKEELNATIQKLYGIESKAEDLINYQSGGIQGQSVDKIKKYVEYVNKEVSKLDVPFGSEVFEVLEDENAHSLNLTLGLLGFYKNERDSGEWAKKYEQYAKVIEVVNEVKGGGLTQKEEKRLNELQAKEDNDNLNKTENSEYEKLVVKYRKAKETKPEAKKPTTRKPTTRKVPVKKAPVKKAVVKKAEVKKEVEAPAKPKADHKKLVAKLKAKKGDKEYDNRASINVKTGERYKRSESSDKKREAKPLGKRVSESGRTYYENRLNRGDLSKEDKFKRGGFIYEVQKKGSPSNDMKETMFTAKNLTELKKQIIEKYGTSKDFLVRRRTEQGYYVFVKFEDGGEIKNSGWGLNLNW